MVKKVIPYFIIGCLAVFSGWGLLQKGLPPSHDGEYHVVRFYEFDKVIRSGVLYPRWAPDLNYGYGVPLFNYVYPLPNYVAFLLHSVGFSFIDTFKLSLFIGIFSSGIFFYLWTKEFWGKIGGVVAAIFYLFSPYYFVDVYIRGSVGEVWALTFLPLFLWLLTKYVSTKKSQFLYFGSVALACLIFSHNILALLFFIFATVYSGVLIYSQKRKKELSLHVALLFFLGILLSAVFWLPALLEKNYVRGLQVFDLVSNFPEVYQLLIPSWGSGFSGGEAHNQMSFQIGVANILAVGIGFVSLLLYLRKKDKRWIYLLFFLLSFFIACFFMLRVSLPLWEIFPLLHYFQFPWRILSLIIVICSFLAGSIFGVMKGNLAKIILAIALSTFVVALGIGYTKVPYYLMRDDAYYVTRSNFIDGTNSPGNVFNTIWIQNIIKRSSKKIVVEQGSIVEKKSTPTEYHYSITMPKKQQVYIAIAYFPGWKVFIDSREQKMMKGKSGNMVTIVPKGTHELRIVYAQTGIQLLAAFLSQISFFVLIFLLVRAYSGIIKK